MTDKQIIITNKRQGKNIYNIIDNKTELTIQSKKFGDITFIVVDRDKFKQLDISENNNRFLV